jgi:hypothetical protein
MLKSHTGQVICQIYIEQRNGGTVWVPWKTVIEYGSHSIEDRGGAHSAGEAFATLDSAMAATQQRAWQIIREQHPNVRKEEVDWRLLSEEVRGFVTV